MCLITEMKITKINFIWTEQADISLMEWSKGEAILTHFSPVSHFYTLLKMIKFLVILFITN